MAGVGARPTLPGMALTGSLIDLNGVPKYLHQGWFLISYANLAVVLLMIAVFALAIWLPFPRGEDED
jgi:hypothetical protein